MTFAAAGGPALQATGGRGGPNDSSGASAVLARIAPGALWTGAAAFALAAHVGIAWWILAERAPELPPAPPPGAITFELAPMPVAPEAELEDVASMPEAARAEETPEPQETPDETAERLPVPETEPLTPEPATEEPPVEETPPDVPPEELAPEEPMREVAPPEEPREDTSKEVPSPVPDVEPEVAVPLPRPRPAYARPPRERTENRVAEKKREPRLPHPRRASSLVSARPAADVPRAQRAAAPQSSRLQSRSSVSPARWQSLLLAHLERRKRYPSSARARREEGTAQLTFTIDRSGNVLSARLSRSSGYPALDQGVLDMIRRASPVPVPPQSVARLTFTVPVRFSVR